MHTRSTLSDGTPCKKGRLSQIKTVPVKSSMFVAIGFVAIILLR